MEIRPYRISPTLPVGAPSGTLLGRVRTSKLVRSATLQSERALGPYPRRALPLQRCVIETVAQRRALNDEAALAAAYAQR